MQPSAAVRASLLCSCRSAPGLAQSLTSPSRAPLPLPLQKFFENRVKHITAAKAAGENPFPHKFSVSMQLPAFIEKYSGMETGTHEEATVVSVAGRVMAKRASGAKLFFYTLVGDGVKLQIMADARSATGYDFDKLHASTRRGDIVGIVGYPGKSKRGELSIFPTGFVLLTLVVNAPTVR